MVLLSITLFFVEWIIYYAYRGRCDVWGNDCFCFIEYVLYDVGRFSFRLSCMMYLWDEYERASPDAKEASPKAPDISGVPYVLRALAHVQGTVGQHTCTPIWHIWNFKPGRENHPAVTARVPELTNGKPSCIEPPGRRDRRIGSEELASQDYTYTVL